MGTPLVSLVTTVYNKGPFLLDMIKSVFAQTFTNWELILLDDSSTDNSLQIAQSIDDPRVRVYANERNLGRTRSRNKAIALARGEYIALIDADDMCSAKRIEKQLELFRESSNVDIVGTGICYLDRNDVPIGHWYPPPLHEQICREPTRTFRICHGSILGKKSWFKKNPYNESIELGEDFNLFLYAYETSTFSNVTEPLYYYRLEQSFNLKKVLIDRLTCAKFLFGYYFKKKQFVKANYAAMMQFVRLMAVVTLSLTGLKKRLLARRYTALSEEEQRFYEQEIQNIRKTKLPIKILEER